MASVGEAHHQAAFVVDVLGVGLAHGVALEDFHVVTQGDAVCPVAVEPRRGVFQHVLRRQVVLADHLRRQAAAIHRRRERLLQGDGHVPYLRREVRRLLAAVHACAGDHIVRPPGLGLQGELREDAAELPPIQHQVVGPLDLGRKSRGLHNGSAGGLGNHRGEVEKLVRRHVIP